MWSSTTTTRTGRSNCSASARGAARSAAEVTVTNSGFEGQPTVTLSDDGRLIVGWTQGVFAGGFNIDNDVEFSILDPRENIINGDGTSETITSRIDGATVNGNGGNDTLLGQGSADTLDGGDGDDLIRGRDGSDLIQGGLNNDTILGDGGNDAIFANTQAAPDGSSVGDTISGGDGFDTITGSNGGDDLAGDADGDLLTGGVGTDTQSGGAGFDTFAFDTGDVSAGEVIDGGLDDDRLLIQSTVSFAGASLLSIEEIEFAVSASAKEVVVQADQIGAGLAADAVIDGNATSQPDTLQVRMLLDTEVDLSDLVFQDFDTAGTENDRVEVVGDGDAERIIGSSFRDDITGGGGNDTLNGFTGADDLNGGDGNDLMSGGAGTGDDSLFGSLGNDTLFGGLSEDELKGGAGTDDLSGDRGHDRLTGGAGADNFLFTTPLNEATNVDLITDFAVGFDEIHLDNAIFVGIGGRGPLAAGRFRVGSEAADANDRIIYNSANGRLFYDADGDGATDKVRFATLDPGLALTAGDFIVI